MSTATLIASILQLATLILSGVSNNYAIPQATRDQAVVIAQSAVSFANQNMPYLQGYSTYTNPYPVYNSPYTVKIMVLTSDNYDALSVARNATYNVVWSPYNPSQGHLDLILYSTAYGTMQNIGRVNSNYFAWTVGAVSGSYELRLMQSGTLIASRNITVQ